MITIIDYIFTEEECSQLIEIYKSNEDKKTDYDGTFPIDIMHLENGIDVIEEKINKILSCVYTVRTDIRFQYGQIVRWPTGTDHSLHIDEADVETFYSSITYLNSDFEGGEFFLDDGTIIKPKPGRTIVFDSRSYEHGVQKIVSGERFSIPIWYKLK
jgi:hypothetical protein